jgi:hypothetical protein
MKKWLRCLEETGLIDVYLESLYECNFLGNEKEWEERYADQYSTEKIEGDSVVNANCKNCDFASVCVANPKDVSYCTNWVPMSPDPNKEEGKDE